MKNLLFVLMVLAFFNGEASAQDISLDKVFCYRESVRSGNMVSVSILVNLKGVTKGKTVKLKEKIPMGFDAKITQPYGSGAEAFENSVTFVWTKMPEADLFIVKYELMSATPVNEMVSLSGTMSYLSEFGMKYISVVQKDFSTNTTVSGLIANIPPYKPAYTGGEDVAEKPIERPVEVITSTAGNEENSPKPKPRVTETTTEKVTPIKTTQETKTVVEQPVVEKQEVKPVEKKPEEQKVVEVKPVETKPVVQEVKPVVEEKKSTGISTVSDMSGVFYTVQIGASKEKLNSDYYNKYSFDKEVNEILIDGMYKYSLGKFPTFKEANSYMPSVKQKNIQCFVVAYMDGKRVSVSEALAVSKK